MVKQSLPTSLLAIISTSLIVGFFVLTHSPSSYAQLELENKGNLSTINQTGIGENWTAYNSAVYGISFDYPSGWNLKEKENRFDSSADVAVHNNDIRFSASKVIDRPIDNPLKLSGLLESTRTIEDGVIQGGKDTSVEPTNVKKYKVGGERTGTFVTKHDDGISPPTGIQTFIIFHKGDGYMLIFRAPVQTFDSPETQSLMSRIIQSFEFVN